MALEGTFEDMSLEDLFQIFRSGSKSGVLLLSTASERAVIYVYDGRLVDAVLVRGPERRIVATGEEAVLQALQWDAARFIFRHDLAVSERPVRIVHDSEWLVLEGLRRRSNPRRLLPHQQITLDSHLELAALPNGAESGVNLDLNQWRILSQVAVSQNLREICEHTGIAAEQAVRTVTELIAIGLIDVVPLASSPMVRARGGAACAGLAAQAVPALAGAAAGSTPAAGRGLLGAIMRRIRSL